MLPAEIEYALPYPVMGFSSEICVESEGAESTCLLCSPAYSKDKLTLQHTLKGNLTNVVLIEEKKLAY